MNLDYFPVGCFGKLPIYGDFISLGAAAREVGELDHWIQRGMEVYQRRLAPGWENDFIQASPLCFLYHIGNADRFLTGILQPSRDQQGRTYPFLFFWLVDRTCFGNNLTVAPVIFCPSYAAAADLAGKAANGQVTMAELHSLVDAYRFPVSPGWESPVRLQNNWLEETTLKTLLTTLFNEFADGRKYTLFGNIGEIAMRLHGHKPSQTNRGLGFPLAGGDQVRCHLASFWLQLIWRMLHKPVDAPDFFWPVAASAPLQKMWFFFRRPSEQLLMPLLSESYNSELLVPLDQAGWRPEESIPLPYRHSLPQSLMDESITLADLIRQF